MAGNSNVQGSFAQGLVIARRRVGLGRRLSMLERIDAYSMVAWGCSALGELAAGEAASAEGLARIQPGQEPAWALHLVAWRIYTLTLMGRWQLIAPLAQRARQLWEEIDRETAGYALRGFVAAALVARSRGESALAAALAEVVATILREFVEAPEERGSVPARWLPLLHDDRAGMERMIAAWDTLMNVPDSLERLLSAMSDGGWPVAAALTAPQLAWATQEGLRPLEIQLRRAVGLRERDAVELDRGARLAEAIGAMAPLARLRFEAARLRNDRAGMDEAIAALEAMGDQGQIRIYRG